MAFLDTALPILIILFLGLAVWAVVSRQTVGEVMEDIRDFFMDKKDNVEERTIGIYER